MAYSLFFELSSEDRVAILMCLRRGASRLTDLSKEMGVLPQEVSRQLNRLERERLIEKNKDGLYSLTHYAETVLALTKGFEFVSGNREYFASHTTGILPEGFTLRLGELGGLTYVGDVMTAFHNVEKMIERSKEYVWIISDQILMSTLPLLDKAGERGVEFKLILSEDVSPPRDFLEGFRPQPGVSLESQLRYGRFLKRLGVGLGISEREIGFLIFPSSSGKFDYLGFRGEDENALGWCRDLFEAYWGSASSRLPEHIRRELEK